MKNKALNSETTFGASHYENLFVLEDKQYPEVFPQHTKQNLPISHPKNLAEILFITSYPPRECGIATYSQDLIKALNNKFSNSLSLRVCAVESGKESHSYPDEVKFILNSSIAQEYEKVAMQINSDPQIKIVLIQHEFGFYKQQEQAFLQFMYKLTKPVAIVFHTVLPHPDEDLKAKITIIGNACDSIVVMTKNSANILSKDYNLPKEKISVIAHGTHLVPHLSKKALKKKYGLSDRTVLTTFGLLSSGKSIETTLKALPKIVDTRPDVLFLIIGKTHPEVVKNEGEIYRESLIKLVEKYKL